ncbi:MAG TPA: high-potential iron-sulfur protein [Lamprocystis sp. (in: g-proteobacteria)]|nr:high-potential iron-sulfur protein [Lamprocystis sp. (in: g-proteobacteria)]
MSDKPTSTSRRDAVKLMLGTAVAIPMINLIGVGSVRAAAAPANAVAADDPTGVALKYNADATKADRAGAARPGAPAAEQKCSTCQFSQAGTDAGWQACTLFPGKQVNANGWCSSWTLKAA